MKTAHDHLPARVAASSETPATLDPSAPDPRLAEAVEAYRAALKSCRRPDRQAFCARYPELGPTLAECLDALEFLNGAAHDLSRADPGNAAGVDGVPALVALGDFRVLREVGRGGMGVVYEAEQISLRRRVALKVLPPSAVLDPRQRQRFHNEAQAAACLHHPNIVPVYAVGTEAGVPYYAMQFITGQTLAAHIQTLRSGGTGVVADADALTRRMPAPPFAAAPDCKTASPDVTAGATGTGLPRAPAARKPAFFRIMAGLGVQAARALDHAHQSGVVHRDVKPANLLLDATGTLWITDFGLAHLQGSPGLTATGDLVGTLRYMSPEQALGQRGYMDHRTDIYSLGVTLYELVTLSQAFPGEERQDTLRQILTDEPLPVRRLNPAVPRELEIIIAKAMAKNPAERYATAQELADDLERFLHDRPIRARPPGLVLRLRKCARRHRSLVTSLAISLLLLVAGCVVGLWRYAEEQHQLALDRAAIAREKEAAELKANKALHRALLETASALRLAREPGYRKRVWANLHEAEALGLPDHAPDAVRAAVIACLGDPLGLDTIAYPEVERARQPEIPEAFQKILREQFDEPPTRSAFTRRGFLATVGGKPRAQGLSHVRNCVVAWDEKGRWALEPLFLGIAHDIQFSPDGSFLIAGCDGGVIEWTIPGGVLTASGGVLPSPGGVRTSFRAGTISSVAVHPGCRLIATAGRQIELWSLHTNRLIASFPSPAAGATVEFSANGQWLLGVVNGQARVGWPVTRTPEKNTLDGHSAGVPAVAFSPDGRLLASVSKDKTLRLWNAVSGQLLHDRIGHFCPLEAVAFSPDGRLIATGDILGGVKLWDAKSGREVGSMPAASTVPPGQIWRLQFTPDGTGLVAAGALGVAGWTFHHHEGLIRLDPAKHLRVESPVKGPVYDLAVHPNGEQMVFLDASGKLHVCALATNALPRSLPIEARVALRGLHFDAKGEIVTYVGKDGSLGVWDWRAGRVRPSGPAVFHLALDPTGRWAAASSAMQGVLLSDVTVGREVLTLPSEGADVWSLAWSPDATRVAIGMSDGGLAIWDLEQVRATLLDFGLTMPSTQLSVP